MGYDVKWYTSPHYEEKVNKLDIPLYLFKKVLDFTGETVDQFFYGKEEDQETNSQSTNNKFYVFSNSISAGMEFLFRKFAPEIDTVKKILLILILVGCFCVLNIDAHAQCSICTKTAQQLGEKPAKGLNAGILYLALAPFAIVGFIGYRWWKRNG